MLRLFTALPLPESLRARAALLRGGMTGARWVPEENYHITLDFIGAADDEMAERADEALSSVHAEKFTLTLQGAGCFSQGDKVQKLWLGVEKNAALQNLKDKTARALASARVPLENRKFTPHLTLARLKSPDETKLAEFLQAHAAFQSAPFPVTAFVLYQSRQTKNGSVYEALKAYPLK